MSFALGRSGGLVYHWSALRFRRGLWRPFIGDLNEWLEREWRPTARELVIFGSSAGWTLKREFLDGFERIIAVEPDPIARALLPRRFAGCPIECVGRADLLPWFSDDSDAAGSFEVFLGRFPNAAILFANVLGQVEFHRVAFRCDVGRARERFFGALNGREWASYHDVFSAAVASRARARACDRPVDDELAPEKTALDFYDGGIVASANAVLVDHDTHWLMRGRTWRALEWQVRPGYFHLIGCVGSGQTE